MQQLKDNYYISTDKAKLDVNVIHKYLRNSYWAKGIEKELIERSIEGSMCFGIYQNDKQVSFARVITDYATFAYLADVFVVESHQGCGLGKILMEHIMQHESLLELRRWMLATRDAHGLYTQFGFNALKSADRIMEKTIPNAYIR